MFILYDFYSQLIKLIWAYFVGPQAPSVGHSVHDGDYAGCGEKSRAVTGSHLVL